LDREWITHRVSDATLLADALGRARAVRSRRVIFAGKSAGARVSLAALPRGVAADGVVPIAAAQ